MAVDLKTWSKNRNAKTTTNKSKKANSGVDLQAWSESRKAKTTIESGETSKSSQTSAKPVTSNAVTTTKGSAITLPEANTPKPSSPVNWVANLLRKASLTETVNNVGQVAKEEADTNKTRLNIALEALKNPDITPEEREELNYAVKMFGGKVEEDTNKLEGIKTDYYSGVENKSNRTFSPTWAGQFGANYTAGDIEQEKALAYNNYLEVPTKENLEYAQAVSDASARFQQNNIDAINYESSGIPGMLSTDIAQYLPQFRNQLTYQAAPVAIGTMIGLAVGNPKSGFNAGATAGSGAYSYQTMRGMAFDTLLQLGVEEDVARAAAKDEAVVSSLIEMADTAIDLATLGKADVLKELVDGKVKKVVGNVLWKKLTVALLKYGINIASEATEEATQESVSIANENRINNYKETGEYESGAWNLTKDAAKVFWDSLEGSEDSERIAEAAKGGAAVAAFMYPAGNITNRIGTEVVEDSIIASRYRDNVQDLINEGLASDSNSKAYKQAQKNQSIYDEKGNLSSRRIANQVIANQSAIDAEVEVAQDAINAALKEQEENNKITNKTLTNLSENDAVLSSLNIEKEGKNDKALRDEIITALEGINRQNIESNSVSGTNTQQTENAEIQGRNARMTASDNAKMNDEFVKNYADKFMGETGSDSMKIAWEAVKGSVSSETFVQEYTKAYNQGKTNSPLNAKISNALAMDAYKSGQSDARIESEGIDYESNGRSEERSSGISSGDRSRSILGRSGEVVSRIEAQRLKAEDIRNRARHIKESSSSEQGLKSGTDSKITKFLDSKTETREMRKLRKDLKRAGYNVHFFVGQMEMVREDSKKIVVRGAIDENDIYIRADHDSLTIQQIAKHELFHSMVKKDSSLMDRMSRKIIEHYSEADLNELVESYVNEYGWCDLSKEYIEEEIFADAYAGIDVFEYLSTYEGATRYTAIAESAVKESNVDAKTTRGPPYLRLSEDKNSHIKEQILSHQSELNKMDVIISVVTPSHWDTKLDAKEWSKTLFNEIGHSIERPGFGTVVFTELNVKNAITYLNTDGEYAAVAAMPYIIKDGIVIGKHESHKHRGYSTVTFGGPVEINGVRGNMGVVVKITDNNKYKAHRILTPDGKVFELNNKTELTPSGEQLQSNPFAQTISSVVESNVSENDKTVNNTGKIKFSIDAPIEQTDRMIAWHNMNEAGLLNALDIGGLAMPSFAIKPADKGHTTYGPISIIARKDSINPAISKNNMIFNGDAWTPVVPSIDYKVDGRKSLGFTDRINKLLADNGITNGTFDLALDQVNFNDAMQRSHDVSTAFNKNTALRIAYMLEQGEKINVPYIEKNFSNRVTNSLLKQLIGEIDIQDAQNSVSMDKYEPIIRKLVHDEYVSKYGKKLADEIYPLDEKLSWSDYDEILYAARKLSDSKTTQTIDKYAIRDDVDKYFTEDVIVDFNGWLKKELNPLIEKKGIRNNKDTFTPTGNRRSFEQLHFDYSLENIVKAMKSQPKQGRTQFLSGPGSVKGASLKSYSSIESVRSELGRLSETDMDVVNAKYKEFGDEVERLAYKVNSDVFYGADDLADILSHSHTKSGIYSYMKRSGFDQFIDVTQELADEIYELGQMANNLPMEYFESKLYRAFYFDEAAGIVVPDNLKASTMSKLEESGANVITYKAGDEADRLAKVNSIPNAKFSEDIDKKYFNALNIGDLDTAQQMVDEAARNAGYIVKAYHGTDSNNLFNIFDKEYIGTNYGQDNEGFFFTDTYSVGKHYAETTSWGGTRSGRIIASYLRMLKPLTIRIDYDPVDSWDNNYEKYLNRFHKGDYDSIAIIADKYDSMFVVFDSNQIKSADPVTYDDAGNVIPLSERFNTKSDDIRYSEENKAYNATTLYSEEVTDRKTLDMLNGQLERGEVTEVYRAMQVVNIDGEDRLVPPMAGKVKIKLSNGKYKWVWQNYSNLNVWERSTEITDFEEAVADGRLVPTTYKDGRPGYDFKLKKGSSESSDVPAAYNPYIHTSLSTLNDQFTSAYKRENLKVVRGYIPNSELTSGYQAQYAKNSVGKTQWHNGVVAANMPSVREVILSRYFYPVEVLDDDIVASKIKEQMQGQDIVIPYNVVSPSLRRSLENVGVTIGEGQGLRNLPPKDSVKYSEDARVNALEADNRRLQKQIEDLKERRDYWRTETTVPNGVRLVKANIDDLTKNILSDYKSDLDSKDVSKRVKDYAEWIFTNGKKAGISEIKSKGLEIAHDIVSNSKELISEDRDTYNKLKAILKGKKGVSLSAQEKSNIPDWYRWRQKNLGFVNINNTGTPVDTQYQELQEMFGEGYFPSTITDPADQLIQIVGVMQSLTPVYENPYNYNIAEATEYCANDLIDRILTGTSKGDINKMPPTRMEQEKARSKKAVEDAIAKEKQNRIEQVTKLKEHYKQVSEDQRTRRAERSARQKLLAVARRLEKLKTTKANKAVINELIGDLDTVAISMTDATVRKLNDLRTWYDNQRLNNPDFIADKGIETRLARLTQKQIADFNMEDVLELTDVLKNIENNIRNARKQIDIDDRRDVYTQAIESIENINNTVGSPAKGLNELNNRYMAESLSPVRMARRIAGYVDSDPFYQAVVRLQDGQRHMLDYQMKAKAPFNVWTNDKKFIESIKGKKAQLFTISGTHNGSPIDVAITRDMLMSLYMHSLNDQNLKHIRTGGVRIPDLNLLNKGDIAEAYARGKVVKIEPSAVRALKDHLTPKELAFCQETYRYFNGESRDAINEVSEKLVGYSLAAVENYYPINTDTNFTRKEFESIKQDGSIEGMGFLKERVDASNPIMLRGMSEVLNKAIDLNSKYVGLAIPVRNFNKLWTVSQTNKNTLNDGTVTYDRYIASIPDMIDQRWGATTKDYIEKMMKDVQGSGKGSVRGEEFLTGVRGNYAQAVLTLNFSVAIKQAASYPTAGAVIGFKPLVQAFMDKEKVNLDTIAKYTPLLWYRSLGFSTTELGDVATNNKQLPAVLNWVQGMDVATTRMLWKASEHYVRNNFKDLALRSEEYYQKVAEVYNRVIEETQPNYLPMQRPQLLRTENEIFKNTVAMFKTQPLQNYNILYDAFANLRAKQIAYNNATDKVQAEKDLRTAQNGAKNAVISQIMQLAVFAGMTALWAKMRGKDDKYREDGEQTIWSFLTGLGKDMVSGAAGMFIAGTEVYNLIAHFAWDETYYGTEAVSISAISDMASSFANMVDYIEKIKVAAEEGKKIDKDKLYKKLNYFAKDISKLVGLPYENVWNLGEIIYEKILKRFSE